MALTPISLFQSQGNGIAQFLQGGQNALASALNNVIQVGRDTVNKQFAQERDFLSEQKRVEDLAQRRGEFSQQQSNWDRTFARNLFVSDRDFADRNEDQVRDEKRMDAQDLFKKTDADRTYDLRKSEAESLQESRDLTIKEAERQAEERQKQEQFEKDILASPGVLPPRSDEAPVRPSDIFRTRPQAMETPETVAPMTPEERFAEADIRMKAAEGKDANAYTKAAREKAAAEAEIKKRTLTSEERTQERFRMAQRSEERALTKEAQTKAEKDAKLERDKAEARMEELVRVHPTAFRPAESYLPPEKTGESEEIAQARQFAKARDADRKSVEKNAALESKTVEDYFAKAFGNSKDLEGWEQLSKEAKRAKAVAVLGEEVVKRREELWNAANKTRQGVTAPAAPGAPAPEASPVQQEIDRIKAMQERNRQ